MAARYKYIRSILLALAVSGPVTFAGASDICVDLFAIKPVLEQTQVAPLTVSRPLSQSPLEILAEASSTRARQPLQLRSATELDQQRQPLRLPVDPKAYERTKFLVRSEPNADLLEDARVVRDVQFGYLVSEGYRALGRANYFVVSKDGRILEIGAGSDALLLELKAHIFGRTLSAGQLRTLEEINAKIITELRKDPRAQAKLEEFVAKRGWPKGIAEDAQLAYFSTDYFRILDWARENGYSKKQLRDAGWLLMKFNHHGEPVFQVNYDNSIKIPYFSKPEQTGIPIWRTRSLAERDDGKKYLGWQNDRSIERPFDVAENLYNGWKLSGVKGKPLIITEGEFKCMIVTKETGILAVGIPGITQFDAKIANAIRAAEPSEVIIVLDRDPVGKGLMRLDGITDSQRAAYTIALALEAAGLKNVKVGTLPDAFDGSKLGSDDLILAHGIVPLMTTLKNAVPAQQYANHIALDQVLHQKAAKRQSVSKTLDSYRGGLSRGQKPADPSIVARLEAELQAAQADLRAYMASKYPGAKNMNEPAAQFASLRLRSTLIASKEVAAETGKGERIPFSRFANDILFMDYVPKDVSTRLCVPKPCARINEAAAELRSALNGQPTEALQKEIERGQKVFREAGIEISTSTDRALLILAGKLAHDFPKDEYSYDFNVNFGPGTAVVPIVIYKKSSGTAVAFARLRLNENDLAQSPDLFSRLKAQLRP